MRRPLPIIPRGLPCRRQQSELPLLLTCPCVAPDWEMSALRALVKPQFKERIVHRPARQLWPGDAGARLERVGQIIGRRLGYHPLVHLPADGDFFLFAEIQPEQKDAALGLALLLSRALPGVWLTFGRLFIRDCKFFRKRPGKRFQLLPAANIHLRREIRAALRDLL